MRSSPILAALALLASARAAYPCAPAPPPGVMVQIAEESAIIVWDRAARREHFVRRASFRTTGRDFGFLVPTPDRPELAEVPDAVFDRLESLTRPEVVHRTEFGGIEPTLLCGFFMLSRSGMVDEARAPVRVLDAQRIGGYDAVVLEADSARALAAWLQQHGYAERPALSAWLAPYVAARWKITAFKIASGSPAVAVSTAAVRMSFTTDRPFFPYREPSDQRENLSASLPAAERERLLRVFFIGGERVDGSIGEAGAPWPGRALWSDRFDPAFAGDLPVPLPEGAWLTMFEDTASPRPGTDDLFFTPARNRASVKPPPVVWTHRVRIPLPLDLVAGAGLVAWILVRRARRRRAIGALKRA